MSEKNHTCNSDKNKEIDSIELQKYLYFKKINSLLSSFDDKKEKNENVLKK